MTVIFDDFWRLVPLKVGKHPCRLKWDAFVKQGVNPALIIAGLRAYMRSKPDQQKWCHPLTFLNQRRWEDYELASGNVAPAQGPKLIQGCERPSDIPDGAMPVLQTTRDVVWLLPTGERVTRPRFRSAINA